jgi:hypothetical protein
MRTHRPASREPNGVRWRRAAPANNPPPRHVPALGWDPLRQRVMLVGGMLVGGNTYAGILNFEVWESDGIAWLRRLDEPRLRKQAHAAFDSTRGRIVVLEGNNTNRFV